MINQNLFNMEIFQPVNLHSLQGNPSLAVRRRGTKRLVYGQSMLAKRKIEYPSEWFNSHPGEKPTLNVYKIEEAGLPKLEQEIQAAIRGGNLKPALAVCYLYYNLKTITEVLKSDWTSYGVIIGRNGDSVNPFSMLSINEAGTYNFEARAGITTPHVKYNYLYLLSIYRLVNTVNQNHRAILIPKLVAQLKECPSTPDAEPNLSLVYATYGHWQTNPDFRKTAAAVDMFFFSFPNNEFANLGIGTLGARHKDCAAPLAYEHLRALERAREVILRY